MRSKFIVLVSALFLSMLIVPTANAYTDPSAVLVYVPLSQTWNMGMHQAYTDEYVSVAHGHWNYQYGNPENLQSVNSLNVRAGTCIEIFWKMLDGKWHFEYSLDFHGKAGVMYTSWGYLHVGENMVRERVYSTPISNCAYGA